MAAVLLSACATVVVGGPQDGGPPGAPRAAGDVTIIGAADDPVDDRARDALADLEGYWDQVFPDVFGQRVPAAGRVATSASTPTTSTPA